MDSSKPSFQTKTLRLATSDAEYKLYRAALEYGLIAPIIIDKPEDLRSKRVWKELIKPYRHQVSNLMNFCRRLPVTLLADDVGLGKTISAGLVVSELMARGRVNKVLVVCPKLLIPQWKEELETKFAISSIGETGSKILKVELPEDRGALITTYHSAREYLDELGEMGFDMLILDEAHKLRNLFGTEKPPEVAKRFKKALTDRLFRYVLMLTATPIQNRLWDLYSLVDLLTGARGHENPFGSESSFARKFIEGDQIQARKLKPEKRDEFRSIVYSYMSRFRRADADLDFPDRKVELYKVRPTAEEDELFSLIEKEFSKMNRLSQISIAQALVSSPQALAVQLENMAINQTIEKPLAVDVREVVNRIGTTAKLHGLSTLIEKLRAENPDKWRVVIFTCRKETQAVIAEHLSDKKITCGLINGTSGPRNQETIAKFKKDIPEIHVIVSTEAGSEGVNLQAANVLVNYDLPWNPMIVEQRIGRVQRLGSQHSSVCIFNMVLEGTFEEYIVARLLEKLQMASHAVGDVEALLEAAGMGEEGESLEDKILKLVGASLAGKNIEAATRLAEKNIAEAKLQLERDEETINATLGSNGSDDSGPLSPKLPPISYSIDERSFVMSGLNSLGADLVEKPSGQFELSLDGENKLINFNDSTGITATTYSQGTPAFQKLADKIAKYGKHQIRDIDKDPLPQAQEIAKKWVEGFGATSSNLSLTDVWRNYEGTVLLLIRTTVAHDSYERLVEVECTPQEHKKSIGRPGLEPISDVFQNPSAIGLVPDYVVSKALLDPGVTEFGRFYRERLTQELPAAGASEYRKKKIQDDLTPRVEITLVGLSGTVQRLLDFNIRYKIGNTFEYSSSISVTPSSGAIVVPEMGSCTQTGSNVPIECLETCQVSNVRVLRHLLSNSEISGKLALPEHIGICSLTNKRALLSEMTKSDTTGKNVVTEMLLTSAVSGKRAEPNQFIKCVFSSSDMLVNESATSEVSGKPYRHDEQARSVISGKKGHIQEFISCAETNQKLLPGEAEICEMTGKIVMPGILEICGVTGKKVMPAELEKSAVSGKLALKKLFVSSSLSSVRLLETEAIRSVDGKFCTPIEARLCAWSGKPSHPNDLRSCYLTGLDIRSEYMTAEAPFRLESLVRLLGGIQRTSEEQESWKEIAEKATLAIGGGNCEVESAQLSPNGQCVAACIQVKTRLGLKTRQVGLLYSKPDKNIVGRVSSGKRQTDGFKYGWVYELHY
ncbi:MAG: SNF2-related protein [Patescibacteria group bacterium]|jgi:superfamily II DNA or RNA helicase